MISQEEALDRLRAAIQAAVAPIVAERGELLSDWSFIASSAGDEGWYITVHSQGTPYHAQVGLAAILTSEITPRRPEEDD